VFAAYEGYRIDTAWRLVWSAMMTVLTRQTSAVPLPALGIGRRRDKGARCGARLRPPLIGAPVTHRNSDANKPLDIAQEADLLTVAQRDRDTFSTRARRTADTMHVGFRHVRQIEIHDVADAIDIDAARGNIRGNERPDFALTKGREHAFPLVLRFVAVNCFGADASPEQTTHDLIGAVLGPCEDQGTVDRFPPQHVDQDCRLCRAIDTNNALIDAFNRRGDRPYRDLERVAQHVSGKFCDGARHGRRKH